MSDTTEPTGRAHLDEETLVSLAEGRVASGEARVHLDACEACRDRLASTRTVLGALATEPPMPDAETFAAQRARIREAIDERRGPAARLRPIRAHARWWVPLAAAAALAAILITRPSPDSGAPRLAERDGAETSTPVETDAGEPGPLPVLAEADRAVDEATREIERTVTLAGDDSRGDAVDGPDRLDSEAIDLALEDLEATDPVLSAGSDEDDRILLEERFAALSGEDQEAILDDLSTMPLEL